jgi:predicted SnoaL-like aldol condensation-catalyzing enzyme
MHMVIFAFHLKSTETTPLHAGSHDENRNKYSCAYIRELALFSFPFTTCDRFEFTISIFGVNGFPRPATMMNALLIASLALTHSMLPVASYEATECGCYGRKESAEEGNFWDDEARTVVQSALKGIFFDRDTSVVDRYFADDFIQHSPDFPNGKEPVYQILSLGATFEPGIIISHGDLVAVHARVTGRTPEPTIDVWMFRVLDGLIVEFWAISQPEIPVNETVSGVPMFEPVPSALDM